jgi:hypothetical protein
MTFDSLNFGRLFGHLILSTIPPYRYLYTPADIKRPTVGEHFPRESQHDPTQAIGALAKLTELRWLGVTGVSATSDFSNIFQRHIPTVMNMLD